MKKTILTTILFLAAPAAGPACAATDIINDGDTGEAGSAAPFLKTGVGARALALGGAFVSVADDATAAYWNPAGISGMSEATAGVAYSRMSLDRSYSYIGGVIPRYRAAAGLIVSGVSDIQGYDANNYPTSKFSNTNMALLLSYAYPLEEGVSVGASVKGLTSRIKNTSAKGYGLDAGVMLRLLDQLSLGFVLQDVYTKLVWDGDYSERVPFVWKMGASYDWFEPKGKPRSYNVKLCLDVEKYSTRDRMRVNAGVELTLPYDIALRGGVADGFLAAGIGLR
jgi:hypothetical protein